jgi:hypothetical protein
LARLRNFRLGIEAPHGHPAARIAAIGGSLRCAHLGYLTWAISPGLLRVHTAARRQAAHDFAPVLDRVRMGARPVCQPDRIGRLDIDQAVRMVDRTSRATKTDQKKPRELESKSLEARRPRMRNPEVGAGAGGEASYSSYTKRCAAAEPHSRSMPMLMVHVGCMWM